MREDPFMCSQVKAEILKYIFSGGEGKQISSFSWISTPCFSQGSAQRLYLTKRWNILMWTKKKKWGVSFHSNYSQKCHVILQPQFTSLGLLLFGKEKDMGLLLLYRLLSADLWFCPPACLSPPSFPHVRTAASFPSNSLLVTIITFTRLLGQRCP